MPEPLRPGDPQQLGEFRLTNRLSEGGQGVVYLGTSPYGEPVAVKLLKTRLSSNPRARASFERELAAARQVDPFCTARIVAADVAGEVPYIVSEFITGPSLQQDVRENGPRAGDALVRLAIGTATALTAIHQAGILHRDFKPSNVIMGPDGPRVIDFGIARAFERDVSVITSQIAGTPAYMAPEQLRKQPLGPAVDVFAWGATIAYAATGRAPFGSDSMAAVVNRILNAPPDLAGLHGPLLHLVVSCLDKDPAQRPTARQLLLRLLGEDEAAAPAPPSQRSRAIPATLLSIAVAAVIAVTVLMVRYLPDRPSGTPASSPSAPLGAGPPKTSRPSTNVTWLENKLGLVMPPDWQAVRTSSGTHVLTTPSCPDPTAYFGTECLGFWVFGANEIARGDEGFGSYDGTQRYYPTADVRPCATQQPGLQLPPEKKPIRKTVPVGKGHTAAYAEWIVPCTENGKQVGSFTQREWYLPKSQILIVDQTDVVDLPGVLNNALWR